MAVQGPAVMDESPRVSGDLKQRVIDLSTSYARGKGLRVEVRRESGNLPEGIVLEVYLIGQGEGGVGYLSYTGTQLPRGHPFPKIAGIALTDWGAFAANGFESNHMEQHYSKVQGDFSDYIHSNL